jgi:hypothetical protein
MSQRIMYNVILTVEDHEGTRTTDLLHRNLEAILIGRFPHRQPVVFQAAETEAEIVTETTTADLSTTAHIRHTALQMAMDRLPDDARPFQINQLATQFADFIEKGR